jgi:glycosyltransferase involved in cell wall biosynthesis
MRTIIVFAITILSFYAIVLAKQSCFVVVTASYNNEKWALQYLNSIFSQDYKNFRVIYYDDCSTDRTVEVVENFVKRNRLKNKIRIVKNSVRVGPHENIYRAVHSCENWEKIVIVDGDDWLAHNKVLSYLNAVYSDPNVWITYGSYRVHPTGKLGTHAKKIPDKILKANKIRTYKWVTGHLRTFYAWLYKRIKIEDLFFDGKFVKKNGDIAIMLPMIEMAGFHSRFIGPISGDAFAPEVLLVYNCANELNYGKKKSHSFVSSDESLSVHRAIIKRQCYETLDIAKITIAELCGLVE